MDIQKLRQEFEKLPDIKGILYGSDFGFNESLNEYYHPDHTNHRLNYAFIMGAWMAWKAKAQAVPEGFVLVPKVKSENFSEKLDDYLDDLWKSSCGFDDGFVSVSEINHDKIWSLVTEAQEQSHE